METESQIIDDSRNISRRTGIYTSSFIYKLFFASSASENKALSFFTKIGIVLLVFAVIRLIAVTAYRERGVNWQSPGLDPAGYVATAEYISAHGVIPTEAEEKYRQFPGLSFLMAAVNPLFGNMVISGNVIVAVSAALTLILIQYLFDDFRLTLLSIVVLPYTVVNTATTLSETPTILCFVVGIWALRDLRGKAIPFCLGMLIMGYSLVIRESAVVYVYPIVFWLAWRLQGGTWQRAVLACFIVSIPIATYSLYNLATIHQLFPQYKLHQQLFQHELSLAGGRNYSSRMIDVPFLALWDGLTQRGGFFIKKVSVAIALGTTFIAIGSLFYRWRKEQLYDNRTIAISFAIGAICHTVFYASFGGNFGYRWIDRHLCEIDPIIVWALFYQRPLRWIWISAITTVAILMAINAGPGVKVF